MNMKRVYFQFVVLAIFFANPVSADESCTSCKTDVPGLNTRDILTGRWQNELGSIVEFKAEGSESEGQITGTYKTAVGNAVEDKVFGTYYSVNENTRRPDDKEEEATVTFAVHWIHPTTPNLGQSATSFAAQLIRKADDTYVLDSSWLLVSKGSEKDIWSAYRVGKNTFFKVK